MVEQKALAPVGAPPVVDKKAPETKKASAVPPEDKLPWWPTDAQPAPVKDEQKGGFWWWPKTPGTVKELWGNRGYAYVNKLIYDWHAGGGTGGTGGTSGAGKTGGTGGTARTGGAGGTGSSGGTGDAMKNVQVRINDISFPETEQKPSLLVKRTVRSQQLQFKDTALEITPEHAAILKKAAATLKRNKDANILITAQKDTPELGSARTQAVLKFLTDQGVAPERIYILAPEKFQEAGLSSKEPAAPGTVQVLIAEVKEVMIPGPKD
jgi:outer membrane protein OmpA-like peptidoglycan-associated protein